MATWTNIADTVLEPGKPIRAIDARVLRDNPIAIARGASGAPKIDGADGPVVETGAITNRNLIGLHAARITDASIPVLTVSSSTAVDLGLARSFVVGTTTTGSTSFVVARTITIGKATGSATFTITHSQVGSFGENIFLRLLKNGTEIASFVTQNIPQTRNVDSSIAPGDVFVWEHRSGFGPGVPSQVINPFERATDGYTTTNLVIAAGDL